MPFEVIFYDSIQKHFLYKINELCYNTIVVKKQNQI